MLLVAAGCGGQLAERLEQIQLVARHGVLALETHGEGAAQPAVPAQRNGGRVACEHRLVALHHLADEPLSDGDRLANPLSRLAIGSLGPHHVGLAEEQADGVRTQQPGGLGTDAQRYLAGVQALVEMTYGIEEARGALRHG